MFSVEMEMFSDQCIMLGFWRKAREIPTFHCVIYDSLVLNGSLIP